MATPTLTRHVLPGVLGDLLVDVRSSARSGPGPVVVIVHGFKGFKDWGFFPPLADRLARSGFTAVSYNASGSGVDQSGTFAWPDRFAHNTFTAETDDLRTVLAAVDDGRLDLARPGSIAVVGHSRGGGIAVLVTADQPRVTSLVSWAAIATVERWPVETRRRWRERGSLDVTNQRTGEVLPLHTDVLDDVERNRGTLDVAAHAARIRIPWLILHGTADETVNVAEAEALAHAAPEALLHLVEGTGHTFGAAHPFVGAGPALEEVLDETVAFLVRSEP